MKFKEFFSILEGKGYSDNPVEDAIYRAGQTQRGIPESVMLQVTLAIQRLGAPAIMVNRFEHYGDLADRASRLNAIGNVEEKVVRQTFNSAVMGDPGGWDAKREIEQNYEDNLWYILREKHPDVKAEEERISKIRPNEDRWAAYREFKENLNREYGEEFQKMKQEHTEKIIALVKEYIQAHEEHNKPITVLGRLGKEVPIVFAKYCISVLQGKESMILLYQLRGLIRAIRQWLEDYKKLSGEEQFAKFAEGYSEPA